MSPFESLLSTVSKTDGFGRTVSKTDGFGRLRIVSKKKALSLKTANFQLVASELRTKKSSLEVKWSSQFEISILPKENV